MNWRATALVYAGAEFGIVDAPVPSIRLKRLRAGLYDVEWLHMLEERGESLLPRTAHGPAARAARVHRRGRREPRTTRGGGWNADPYAYGLARELLIEEVMGSAGDAAEGSPSRPSSRRTGAG